MALEIQQGIARAASVLSALGASTNGGMRASEIGRATGLGASTMARLLSSLEEFDYVSKNADTQLYTVGPAILKLSSQGLNQNPVHRESRVVAEALAQQTGLSVNVGVRNGHQALYLCHFEGLLAPKEHTMVGMSQPLHASGMGKCLLLDMTEEQRRDLLGESSLASFTTHTITDHAALSNDLADSLTRGVCVENQELALGRFCIASPIRDASGWVVASISISGRATVMREQNIQSLTEQVIEAADRISVGLGMISAVRH